MGASLLVEGQMQFALKRGRLCVEFVTALLVLVVGFHGFFHLFDTKSQFPNCTSRVRLSMSTRLFCGVVAQILSVYEA